MVRTDDRFKARLQADGRWEEFNFRIDEERRRTGEGRSAVRKRMLKAYFPTGDPAEPSYGAPVDGGGVEQRPDWLKRDLPVLPEAGASKGEMLDSGVFKGKVFSLKDGPEYVAWVVSNVSIKDVKPEDAPNAFAWSILCRCRENMQLFDEMLLRTFPRLIPTKAPEETKQEDDFDGKAECDLLGKLLAEGGA